jgi:hypothetical protein
VKPGGKVFPVIYILYFMILGIHVIMKLICKVRLFGLVVLMYVYILQAKYII